VPSSARSAAALEKHLRGCGYGDAQLAIPFTFDNVTVPIAAFAGKPWDSWSACIAVVDSNGDSEASAAKVRPLGAPTAFVCHQGALDWWKQGPSGPIDKRPISWGKLARVFEEHKTELHPDRIYGAKLRKPDAKASQLWFFDAGLMPAVERDRGQTMARLVEDVIDGLRDSLGPRLNSRPAQEDVYRTVFWLLAAKVLHDKRVRNFIRIDLKNVDEVFDRIGKHHGETDRFPPFGKSGRLAINAAADRIATCASLADVSSESLAYVYENTLIDKAAGGKRGTRNAYDIRKELGIHSTPSVLINHMLSQLWPLIEQIPEKDRHVFEPACGHAPFLTAAMRWLRDWGKGGSSDNTHDYLRTHLHGVEADPFAKELARLSLTVGDEPHGNSWDIKQADMFNPGVLQTEAKRAGVLLANPPYEPFSPDHKACYRHLGETVSAKTKVVEVLNRTIRFLPSKAVFGVVVPQGVLHSDEAKSIRKTLVSDFEIAEISLFADNLFEKADAETAIVLGHRKKPMRGSVSLRYRRVRENGMELFKERLTFTWERVVPQERFSGAIGLDLRVPELEEVWKYLDRNAKLAAVASVGQGLIHHGKELPKGQWTVEPYRRGRGAAGFAEVPSDLCVFGIPKRVSINLDKTVIRRPVSGTTVGVPQVLVNYAPVSRQPWKLKAVLDLAGHAVTSRFLTVRPKENAAHLEYYWGLLNSPVANAFVHCHSMKRDILAGLLREFPVPTPAQSSIDRVVSAANAYLAETRLSDRFALDERDEKTIRQALLRLDAEVLRLYDLPPRLERELLDFFRGAERKGVGCTFGDYFPADFRPCIPLHEYISEGYQRSTAGELAKGFQPVRSEAALAALDLAERTAAGE